MSVRSDGPWRRWSVSSYQGRIARRTPTGAGENVRDHHTDAERLGNYFGRAACLQRVRSSALTVDFDVCH
jgi:hypothetical protein